ncbi:MAG TPA: penicillin-binding transpeptidase domain-containing protein, partial [Devosia sp.]|nr:penicillin-binding transpeptidase domain-containing protein [Devosia sp.]
NRAIVSNRQPGSAYKIFVYSEAFEQLGLTPKDMITDRPVCIGDWCPQNYGRSYKGTVTLASAFAQSLNTVPVTLSIKTGRDTIAALSHRMGLRADYPVTRSLALGVASVSVLDMTSSYAVLADDGYKTQAYGINRIASLTGDVIYESNPNAPRERVLSETTVANMNSMLRGVITGGTGRKGQVEGVPVVGKSGTTSSYRDAWFAGFSGNFVSAVWMGNDDYSPTKTLTGGNLPAVAWQKFMAYAHTNIEILPVFGVDFVPEKTVIADADPTHIEEAPAERPPTLKPAAARKLVDMADMLALTLKQALPITDQASTAIPARTSGL